VVRASVSRRFVVDSLALPTSRVELGYDLNGDGKLDDQLGNVIGALRYNGYDAQGIVNGAIAAGTFAPELEVLTTDAKLREADGTGTLFGDGKDDGVFCGEMQGGSFASAHRSINDQAVQLALTLPFFGDARVQLHGARLRYRVEGDRLLDGVLNGAVRKADMETIVTPRIAALLNEKITGDPGSQQTAELLSLFDTGGKADPACGQTCKNTGGSCAVAGNRVIEVCEVATNGIARNVLAPDVQLFDGDVYAPSAANLEKDSFSLGVGFTARALPK
jgi:hypothetical protein